MDVGQTTVAKYMAKRRRPPSQCWRTFVHNHADAIASIDMFVVPTISFGLLYGLVTLRRSRRELLWLGVTAHPNAEWLARQLTEACGWDEPPRYLIRDRDGAYGAAHRESADLPAKQDTALPVDQERNSCSLSARVARVSCPRRTLASPPEPISQRPVSLRRDPSTPAPKAHQAEHPPWGL
jgi:hypothetical protein